MPSRIYLLQIVLGGMDGKSQMTIPVKAYSSADAAEEALRLRSDVMRAMLGWRVHDATGDTGVTVAGVLRDLGLHGFSHVVDTINVHDGVSQIVVPKPPSLIIER